MNGIAIDPIGCVNEYLDRSDWRVNANANQDFSYGGLVLNVAGKVIANYWLSEVFSDEAATAHKQGAIHIHDLDVLGGYCAGWSLRQLLEEGLSGVPNAVNSAPPKHMSSACGQIVNFLGTLQNEWAGAQAFSSFDTYMAPFVRLDRMTYDEVRQCLQEMVFSLNASSRWGSQTPFTNLTFDITCPADLAEQYPLIGDEVCDFTYGELAAEMELINRAFIDVMSAGDVDGRVFTFPIPTYNITEDFAWESTLADDIFAMTAKYGLPYFQNFINSDLNPGQIRSMCCRLQLDLRELEKRGNGLFGSAEQTGSIGVVTINLARLGYLHKGDWEGLITELDHLIDVAADTLERRRAAVDKFMQLGLYPYSKRWLASFDNHFSTIGVNGGNEMVRNFTDDATDLASTDGEAMARRVLEHIRARLVDIQEATGHMYNLEATPAEGATYRFAKTDRAAFPDILQAGTKDNPYYTNSTQLPVDLTDDPFEALDAQDELQTLYTGGTVLHLYLGASLADGTSCKALVRRALETHRLPYLTVTPTFSICPTHGYLAGEHFQCPTCGNDAEVWTRVMGYFRPVSSFNIGKKGEYFQRTTFTAPVSHA